MSNGLTVEWQKGDRVPSGTTDKRGFVPRLGKNQGPVFSQVVVKILKPKVGR